MTDRTQSKASLSKAKSRPRAEASPTCTDVLGQIDAAANKVRTALTNDEGALSPAARKSVQALLKSITSAQLSGLLDRLAQEGAATRNPALELGVERDRRRTLEAVRIDHLNRIVQLVGERDALEIELQDNAARYRKQITATPSQAQQVVLSATSGVSPTEIISGLPEFTRKGRLDKAKARALHSSARQALKAARWPEAVSLFREYLSYHPRRAAPWKQFGHALKEAGQLELAEGAYFKSLSIDAADTDTALHLGHLLKRVSKTALAAEIFAGALAMQPDHKDLRNSLGDLGYPLPQFAARPPRVTAEPVGLQAWLLRREITGAQKAAKAKRWGDSAKRYLKLTIRRPHDARLLIQYGHALKEMGDLKAAEQVYRQATDLQPLNSDAWLHLGHILKMQGDMNGARTSYETAVRFNPNNMDARHEL